MTGICLNCGAKVNGRVHHDSLGDHMTCLKCGSSFNIETEAVEVCPHCETENIFANWNTETNGYVAICSDCGKEMMLCDLCLHADDNPDHKCDWREENDMSVCFRGKHSM